MVRPEETRTDAAASGRRVVRLLVILIFVVAVVSLIAIAVRPDRTDEEQSFLRDFNEVVQKPTPPNMEEKRAADELFSASVEAYRDRDAKRATNLAELALEGCVDDELLPKIHNLLGIIHHENGRHPEAVAEFLKAIRHDRENAGYHFNWAEALRAEGHPVAAIAPMQRAAQLRPADTLARIKLSFLLIESGQVEAMAEQVNRISGEGALQLDQAFAKAALLRLSGQDDEYGKLLAKLKEAAPAELYELCLKDPVFRLKPREASVAE